MLAYREGEAGWAQWQPGSRVPTPEGGKGLTPPPNAEAVLSDQELATLGLWRVEAEGVPEGKVAISWTLTDQKGAPVLRPTLEDAPPPRPIYVSVPTVRERLEAIGLWDALIAALPPAKLAKVLSLREGISPEDGEARYILTEIGADPDAILAPE